MKNLTYVMENYLEAIYELSKEKSFARTSDIAEKLNVSKASVNSAMQTLINKGLITSEKYREIYLTEEGKKIAEFTSKKHKTIKNFFTGVLGVDDGTADSDACAIEHVISQNSVKAMDSFLKKTGSKKPE
jgi:DtxR family Mn-dependent transcriptional regulator